MAGETVDKIHKRRLEIKNKQEELVKKNLTKKKNEEHEKAVEAQYHPKYVDSDGWVVGHAKSYADVEQHEKWKAKAEERKKNEQKAKEEKVKEKAREEKEKKEIEESKKHEQHIKEQEVKKHKEQADKVAKEQEIKSKRLSDAEEQRVKDRIKHAQLVGNRTAEANSKDGMKNATEAKEANDIEQQHKEAMEDTKAKYKKQDERISGETGPANL